jgi:serine/threonine protein kinase/class 3 adenylate cyclase
MMLGDYRLLAQVGAGKDGVAYRAQTKTGEVTVHVLHGAAPDPHRWPLLTRRLRLAALLDHPAAVVVRALQLEHDPPYLVVDAVETQSLAQALQDSLPLPALDAVGLIRTLAEVLTAAHRLGLVHGDLAPETVQRAPDGAVHIDFTAPLDTGSGLCPGRGRLDSPAPGEDGTGLGALLLWLLTGDWQPAVAKGELCPPLPDGLPAPVRRLLGGLLARDPGERLAVRDAALQVEAFQSSFQATRAGEEAGEEVADKPPPDDGDDALPRERLGRFRLLDKLGQGGMGAVYKAVDCSDGRIVAIKVLRANWTAQPQALARFHKEARLLAEINNPYVTNLLEVNEDEGFHYLALEFVAGESLDKLLRRRGRLDERDALAIMADVARALVDAHAAGIVHRDVKPANILLTEGRQEDREDSPSNPVPDGSRSVIRAKLSDFGLARHVVESESLNVTRAGAILGTLLYMSPEQCAGAALDVRADVYSLGATLYHLLAGRPPFLGDGPLALIQQHTHEQPPSLRKLNSTLSDGVCQVVAKALAKNPADRYPDAAALLHDLQCLLEGEPASILLHPRRPTCDPGRLLRYEFAWDLESPPDRLWPHVSNTERLNRALGMSAVRFTVEPPPASGGVHPRRAARPRRFGEFHKAGLSFAWEEHPFEWVEGRRLSVLREYSEGPFKWLVSMVDLAPRGAGTHLTHTLEVEPRTLLGRTLAAVEIGTRTRRALERAYHRIDAILIAEAAAPQRRLLDPFEEPAGLTRAQRRRLDGFLDTLVARGVPADGAEGLIDFVAHAAAQEVARIRPLALARRLGLNADAVVAACLHGAHAGLLVLLWDVICPLCRIPTEVKDTLRRLHEHEHCPACDLEFRLDFAQSVELIFRVHPEVRACELATYCIGGPAHSPHVAAQARVAPGERLELQLTLGEGAYRLRGPQLPFTLDFRVQNGAGASRWELPLTGHVPDLPRVLRAGRQLFCLSNNHKEELVVRVERTAARADALTAARASALALFRELFPDEILSPGQLISVATMTLLVTDVDQAGMLYDQIGDAKAFSVIHEHFRLLSERIRAAGGAVVKTVGEGVIAAFTDAAAAVAAGLDFPTVLADAAATRDLRVRTGIHRGPVLATTLNEQLDYFGTTVRQALVLPSLARGGEVILTAAVTSEPLVAALLQKRGLRGQLFEAALPGAPAALLQRFALGEGRPGTGR